MDNASVGESFLERLGELSGLSGDKDGQRNVINVCKSLMAGNKVEAAWLFSALHM